jgi:hypothetical protein
MNIFLITSDVLGAMAVNRLFEDLSKIFPAFTRDYTMQSRGHWQCLGVKIFIRSASDTNMGWRVDMLINPASPPPSYDTVRFNAYQQNMQAWAMKVVPGGKIFNLAGA